MKQKGSDLTFLGHLDELRSRIIKTIIFLAFSCCVAYFYVDKILSFLIKPIGMLIFVSPTEAFLANITVIFISGLLITMPFVLYQVWQFTSVGLTQSEKRNTLIFIPASIILFVLGALFAYFAIIPIALKFLLGFSTMTIQPMITVGNYVSFIGMMVIAFGVVFEFPLVISFLVKIGVATPEFLAERRKYAILLIFILSALLTPPDCITQLLMAVPLIVLYEVGIMFAKITSRSTRKKGSFLFKL